MVDKCDEERSGDFDVESSNEMVSRRDDKLLQ